MTAVQKVWRSYAKAHGVEIEKVREDRDGGISMIVLLVTDRQVMAHRQVLHIYQHKGIMMTCFDNFICDILNMLELIDISTYLVRMEAFV